MVESRTIEVGRTYVNGGLAIRVVRVHEHGGTVKVWYGRADGKDITHWLRESWMYEDEFRAKFMS